MKINTLRFVLPKQKNKASYKANEIIKEICKQKDNFIKKLSYEPEYISMDDDLNNFLYEQLTINNSSFDLDKNKMYNPKTIAGMKIVSRFQNEYQEDNEITCV